MVTPSTTYPPATVGGYFFVIPIDTVQPIAYIDRMTQAQFPYQQAHIQRQLERNAEIQRLMNDEGFSYADAVVQTLR